MRVKLGIIGCRLPPMTNAGRWVIKHNVYRCVLRQVEKFQPESVIITLDNETGPWVANLLRRQRCPYTVVTSDELKMSQKARYWMNGALKVIKVTGDNEDVAKAEKQLAKDTDRSSMLATVQEGLRCPTAAIRMAPYIARNIRVMEMSTHLFYIRNRQVGIGGIMTHEIHSQFDDNHVYILELEENTQHFCKHYFSNKKAKQKFNDNMLLHPTAKVAIAAHQGKYNDEDDEIPF